MKITVDWLLKEELERENLLEGHTFLSGDPLKAKFWERMADITEHPPEWLEEEWAHGNDIEFPVVNDDKEYGILIREPPQYGYGEKK